MPSKSMQKKDRNEPRMLSEDFQWIQEDSEIWLERYRFWTTKILKAEKELKSIIKIIPSQYAIKILLVFWVYISPLGVPDEERKELGRWIMKLIDNKEAPIEIAIESKIEKAYRFQNTIVDKHGKYEINFNLVI